MKLKLFLFKFLWLINFWGIVIGNVFVMYKNFFWKNDYFIKYFNMKWNSILN